MYPDPETVEEYFDRLKARGYKEIGKGDFSTVFEHPRSRYLAVKVSVNEDDGALQWLDWCQKNPSPYVPRVSFIKEFHLLGHLTHRCRFFAAYMERLQPATEEEIQVFIDENHLHAVLCFETGTDGRYLTFCRPGISHLCNEPLRQIFTKIHELTDRSYCDLKVPNFMKRGSQIVITDPVPY